MTPQEQRDQLARMEAKLAAYPDFIYVPPKAKYVGLNNDGEVELEETESEEENGD